jgi:hypothetical protein
MENGEASRIVDELLGHARYNYERNEWLKKWEAANQRLNTLGLIQRKEDALSVCDMLIQHGLDTGVIPFGSIRHRLGIQLLDYLIRSEPAGREKEKT